MNSYNVEQLLSAASSDGGSLLLPEESRPRVIRTSVELESLLVNTTPSK